MVQRAAGQINDSKLKCIFDPGTEVRGETESNYYFNGS